MKTMKRCGWADGNDLLLQNYHDTEFGKEKGSDIELFEKLCLECFQAGLSWRTVLYKREAFRQLFYGFDVNKVAEMSQEDVERLMADKRIVRNHRKIEAVIGNAQRQLALFGETGSFKRYVYSMKSGAALSEDLIKKGYRFVGPTICESFLQSVGAIEGHEEKCFLYRGDR